MKKTTKKTLAVLSSLALLFAAGMFVSCSDSDDDDSSSTTTTTPSDNPSNVDNETAKATAKTYSFAGGTNGVVLADLDGWDMATKDVIGSPIASTATTKTLSNGAILHWKGSKVGTLRFRSTHTAGAELTEELVAAATALNYNGGAGVDLTEGVTISEDSTFEDAFDRFVEIAVDGAGTVTAKVDFKGAKESDGPTGGPLQAVFMDKDGKLLGSVASDNITASSTDVSVTGTVSAAGSVYLVFSRNGAQKSSGSGTGGLDVKSIEVKPAE